MEILADINFGKVLGPALAASLVPLVLIWLINAAQAESLAKAGERVVVYPKALKIFVFLQWIGFAVLIFLIGTTAKDVTLLNMSAIVGLLASLIIPLHLEAFGVMITWDDQFIFTRSPWRKQRKIPISAVLTCDYSATLQWYRVKTEGYGTIRLHQFARGIPEFLKILPCSHPPYPPGR